MKILNKPATLATFDPAVVNSMSVYTTITHDDLKAFLTQYAVGDLVDFRGISEGIDNTNYFVTTRQHSLPDALATQPTQDFVLTIFERLPAEQLPYFLNLLQHLSQHHFACAKPILDQEGQILQSLLAKPAAMVERLPGQTVTTITESQCADIGQALAELHIAGQSYSAKQVNRRGLAWCQATAQALEHHLPTVLQAQVTEELAVQLRLDRQALPVGTIHGDLFHDNALYDGTKFSGIIDFYFACHDILLYDLAVTINDWCKQPDQPAMLDQIRLTKLLQAYHARRPITATEQTAFTTLLRGAALSWWLSRLYDQHFPRDGELTLIKDPQVFETILTDRIQQADTYQAWLQQALS